MDSNQIRAFTELLLDLPDGARLPDWSDMSIANRFAIALRLIPSAQRIELLGKSDAQLRRYKDDSDVPLGVVVALAAETEIPIEWIATGHGMERGATLPDLDERGDAADVAVRKLQFKVDEGELVIDGTGSRVRIPRHILQHAGVAQDHARLWQASGDSMRDTISDGDLLLVDISPAATQLVEGKIYLFSLDNEPHVKRLKKSVDGVIMISDNRDMFPPESVPSHVQLKIHGRVKWAGRCL